MKYLPQITFIVLIFVELLLGANQHGKPRINSSFWRDLFSISSLIVLLFWGGFFDVFFK